MPTYAIRHSHGLTESAPSYHEAIEALREVYGPDIVTEGDTDCGARVLVWQDEEAARDDDGVRAVAMITCHEFLGRSGST